MGYCELTHRACVKQSDSILAQANDNSGYIGAAIVGSFIFVVSSWYATRFLYRKWQARKNANSMA